MDADQQDDPKDLVNFIKKIDENYDIIIGKRIKRRHSYVIVKASYLYNIFSKYILKFPLKTSNSSFAAFKIKFINNLTWYKNDHRYLPIIAASKGAKKLCNITISHRKRTYGETKYNTFLKLIRCVYELFFLIIRIYLKFNYIKN